MYKHTTEIVRTTIGIVLAAGIAMIGPMPAFADDGTSVLVSAGATSISNPLASDFTAVTLDGTPKTTTASLATFSVMDARGTGVGWHVMAQATQFTGGGFTLPLGSLSLSAPTVTQANGTTSTSPTVTSAGYTIDNALATTIASAALQTGMGTYDFSATTLSLALTPSVHAATYLSTVTISFVTAP